MLEYFEDWQKKTVTFQGPVTTVDSSGIPVTTFGNLQENVAVNWWIDTSQVTNKNDKFVNDVVGKILVNPDTLTIDLSTAQQFTDSTYTYYITGYDDIANFEDVCVISWRRERGN